MFVKRNSENSYLNVGADFFSIVGVRNNGDVVANLIYSVKQNDAIRLNAITVKVDVYANAPTNSYRTNADLPLDQPRVVAAHVAQLASTIKREIKQSKSQQNLLLTTYSDITSKINNELVRELSRNGTNSLSNVPSMYKKRIVYKSVGELAANNENVPLLRNSIVSGSSAPSHNDVSMAMLNLVYKGIDPADVVRYGSGAITTRQGLGGLVTSHIREEYGPMKKLIDAYIGEQNTRKTASDLASNYLIPTIEQEYVELIEINETIILPFSKIKEKPSEITLNFQLLSKDELALDLISKKIDIMRYVKNYSSPQKVPNVTAQQMPELGRASLRISTDDKNTGGVRIYRKMVNSTHHQYEAHEFVKQLPLSAGQMITVPVEFSELNADIFRITAVGKNGTESSEFASVVIRPKNHQDNRRTFVSLITRIVKNGIQLEAHDIPPHVVSFQFMRIDKTIHEKASSVVENKVIFANEENEVYVQVDTAVRPYHVYEYHIKMIMDNGSEKNGGQALVEYFPLVDDLVDTSLSDVNTTFTSQRLNVTFNLVSKITETNMQTVKNLLTEQNLLQFFEDDVIAERSKLEQLLAHYVTRTDITTGQREDFGVITSKSFSDEELAKVNAVQPLQVGHKYRYEVSACLRAPETVLHDYVKTATDQETKKVYSFKPSVYYHPVALRQGNITDEHTLKAYHAKQPLVFGYVGNLTDLDVSFIEEALEIVEASAFRFGRNSNIVRFDIRGNKRTVDHFIIMKESLGVKTLIGKAHAHTNSNFIEYIHNFGTNETGQLFYHIIPVFNNYKLGTVAKTNDIVA